MGSPGGRGARGVPGCVQEASREWGSPDPRALEPSTQRGTSRALAQRPSVWPHPKPWVPGLQEEGAGIGQSCTPASRREEPSPHGHSHSSRPAQPPARWLSVQQQHQRAPAGGPTPEQGPRPPGGASLVQPPQCPPAWWADGQVGPVRPPTHQSTPATDASSTVPSRASGAPASLPGAAAPS